MGGSWRPGPELPHQLCYHCQVDVGGQVIIAGGRLGSDLRYEDASDKTWLLEEEIWSEIGLMSNARFFHACAQFSGKMYSIGGQNMDGMILSSVEVYDPATHEWTKGPKLPVGITMAQAFTYENMLYVLAGQTAEGTNRQMFLLFAPDSQWEVLPGVDVENQYRSVFPAVEVSGGLLNCQ